jgi:HPt (histidine-containing phosphotransfer) domain-containing protein
MSSSHTVRDSNSNQKSLLPMQTSATDKTRRPVDITVLTSFEDAQIESEPDLIVELIDLYLVDAPRQMTVMRKAMAETDKPSLKRAAHSLKGSSANLGANQMAALCAELEHAEYANSLQSVGALVTRLEQEFESVRQTFAAERQRRLSEL